MLIGSRKFTEGWSSWRVSTMGLLNMGQGEGSQIIQLFGRGVRLKGKGFSLKRTTPQDRPRSTSGQAGGAEHFGVRASYMAAFKEYLREEGVTPSDEILELVPRNPTYLGQAQDAGAEGRLQGQPETRLQANLLPVVIRDTGGVERQDQDTGT